MKFSPAKTRTLTKKEIADRIFNGVWRKLGKKGNFLQGVEAKTFRIISYDVIQLRKIVDCINS